jgi:hypothetical protein
MADSSAELRGLGPHVDVRSGPRRALRERTGPSKSNCPATRLLIDLPASLGGSLGLNTAGPILPVAPPDTCTTRERTRVVRSRRRRTPRSRCAPIALSPTLDAHLTASGPILRGSRRSWRRRSKEGRMGSRGWIPSAPPILEVCSAAQGHRVRSKESRSGGRNARIGRARVRCWCGLCWAAIVECGSQDRLTIDP